MSPIQSVRADAGWLQGFSLGPSTPRSIVPASLGNRDSAITRFRRRSTIVSTCSMSTGHSCTHAPQVTQSQTTSSVTAFGTSGCSSTLAGSRIDPGDGVAEIHDQELRAERLARVPGGTDLLTPAALRAAEQVEELLLRQVLGGRDPEADVLLRPLEVDLELLEVTARAVLREVDVRRRGDDVQVLGLRQVGEEPEHDAARATTRRRARASRSAGRCRTGSTTRSRRARRSGGRSDRARSSSRSTAAAS